jgi:hypothetical protein
MLSLSKHDTLPPFDRLRVTGLEIENIEVMLALIVFGIIGVR